MAETILHKAAELGDPEIMNFLLEHGAEGINEGTEYQGIRGTTPLMLAVHYGRLVGVDIYDRSKPVLISSEYDFGRHALSRLGDLSINIDKYVECAKLLLEHGADPSIKDELGRTASDLAVSEREEFFSLYYCVESLKRSLPCAWEFTNLLKSYALSSQDAKERTRQAIGQMGEKHASAQPAARKPPARLS